MKSKIMIIDDHPIIHDGLRILLSNEPDLSFIEGAFTSSSAMEQLKTEMPDLAIIDLSLGESDGSYLVQRIKSKYKKLKVLVYSMSEENLFAERMALAGAQGYVMKTASSNTLKEAIALILSGKTYFPNHIEERVNKKKVGRATGNLSVLDNLSNREIDVFKLVGEGHSTTEIAERLNISRNTVDTHRINIKNKLELPNGRALDRLAYKVIKEGE